MSRLTYLAVKAVGWGGGGGGGGGDSLKKGKKSF